mgnify:CR=1 FL=1
MSQIDLFVGKKYTLTPQGSVARSICNIMVSEIFSRSDKISARLLVPKMVLSVVEANNLVLLEKSSTLQTAAIGPLIL